MYRRNAASPGIFVLDNTNIQGDPMKKSVSLLFSAQITNLLQRSLEDLFEEIIVVFDCVDDDDLKQKSLEWAKMHEHEYKNEAGEMVYWKFVEILHISPLETDEIQSGIEIFSRFLTRKQVNTLIEDL